LHGADRSAGSHMNLKSEHPSGHRTRETWRRRLLDDKSQWNDLPSKWHFASHILSQW
jgi:hypothetical protein